MVLLLKDYSKTNRDQRQEKRRGASEEMTKQRWILTTQKQMHTLYCTTRLCPVSCSQFDAISLLLFDALALRALMQEQHINSSTLNPQPLGFISDIQVLLNINLLSLARGIDDNKAEGEAVKRCSRRILELCK